MLKYLDCFFFNSKKILKYNIFKKKKANFNYFFFKRPKTRGVAKNCVDHPNGGKGRSGILKKKSPWGW